jgi:serine phosphatase RsbU (regulator of sigma subunit)/DNA-binding response OmpR family regulator/anti-sigma regulatory factor (Ser/Thr protein kinase)
LSEAGARQGSVAPQTAILLVDDHEENLLALEAVLAPLGQRLVRARSGEEALRRLLRDEFAVILLDVRMPGMDGFETARYINARERTRHTPIIFLTGHDADTKFVFEAYEAGAVDYVLKPFEPAVMRSKVLVFVNLYQERTQHIREAAARAQAEAVAATVRKLQALSDAALAHLQMSELLPELLGRAAALCDAATAGLLLAEQHQTRLRLHATYGLEAPDEACTVSAGEGFLGRALGAAGAVALAQVTPDSALHASLAATGVRSLLAAPLVVEGRRLGVLYLGSRRSDHFSVEDAELMTLGAERAAIALDHAQSYEHERRAVEMLQRSLLPERLPELSELQLAARYLPSGSAAKVGGDWYDAILLRDSRVGLAIGDVVGHGVRAATVMGELRNALRAYVLEGHPPGEAVTRLNDLVESTHGEGMVATLTMVTLDPSSGSASLSNAGHMPALLLSADRDARYVEHHTGIPIGVGGCAKACPEHQFTVELGSTLVLFTDGLVERRGRSIDDGLEQLREAVSQGPADLEELCTHVLSELLGDCPASDDVALLAVRMRPPRVGHLVLRLPAEASSVPVARHAVGRLLDKHGANAEDAYALRLAVSEGAANVIEHAYDPTDHEFEVAAEVLTEGVYLTVRYNGRWRSPRGRVRGHGLNLIEQLVDHVDVQRSANGTTLRMFKRMAEWRVPDGQ